MRSDEDFDHELSKAMRELPVPPDLEERVVSRARRQAGARAPGRSRLRPRPRRLALIAATLLIAGAGTAAAAFWVFERGDGATTPAGPDARAAIAESEILARAGWLRQPAGAPHLAETSPTRALSFPPGTSYRRALDLLLRSVVEEGGLPAQAELVEPLAEGVVWAPAARGDRPRLDLRAPWGYEVPAGTVRAPAFNLPRTLTPAEADRIGRALSAGGTSGEPLPAGVRITAPRLRPCQVQAPGEINRPCVLTPPPGRD